MMETTTAPTMDVTTIAPTMMETTTAPTMDVTTIAPTMMETTTAPTMGDTTAPTMMETTTAPTMGDTTAPTMMETTSAPSMAATTAPTPPGSVATSSLLNLVISQTFGRLPTQTEIDGLMVQVNQFYNDVLTNVFGADFMSFTATVTDSNSNVAGPFTIAMINHDDVTTFADGATIPSQAEVDQAIQDADLSSFIQNYLPSVLPEGNIFMNTIMASSSSTTGG
ncbi:expressed unknown protein [Seminavis robusta]|uniref:Uncharacterized protein n=1 Tax=Seminavis robusta TaxID=568900 RepID=A0A9N8E4H5_9STRA|nr:expressed unknown protein [Seminavis robusta]|eukprot:Sro656_g182480.1 n/a (223) ;mRNA; f:45987-46655